MKKLDIIQELGKQLRHETVSLTELCILLALYQGDETGAAIAERTELEISTVSAHIANLLKYDNISCTALRRGKNPASYALTESGYHIILQCIPMHTTKLKNGHAE